jgi:hypothetical protein
MIGSLGECLVANFYGLKLKKASNKGFDAVTECGLKIEIKATQANSVAFRSQPQHTIIIKLMPNGTFDEIYNGPGAQVWEQFKNKQLPSNGQFQISLNKLRQLNASVAEDDRVPRVID